MDRGFPDRNVGQLLSDDMGRIPHRYVFFPLKLNLFRGTFVRLVYDALSKIFLDELMVLLLAGQLYLGVFSGPTEGIVMIVLIFIITGFYGKVLKFCGGYRPNTFHRP